MIFTKKRNSQLSLNANRKPIVSITVLLIIGLGCLFAEYITPYDKNYMNLAEISRSPSMEHLFGTDTLGRDMFSMIWFGGRNSLIIGITATVISTFIAIIYGCVCGLCGKIIDDLLMRFSEILMSIPSILIIILFQAVWGEPGFFSISIIIGITSWMNISKIVRSEVRQIGESDYILAARTMKGGFFYIIKKHLIPNFIPSIMYMVVTNIGSAIAMEATLSFLGLGLPLTEVSWGSLMSMSEEVMLSNYWWIFIMPGGFLITTLVCITDVGEYVKKQNSRLYSNL